MWRKKHNFIYNTYTHGEHVMIHSMSNLKPLSHNLIPYKCHVPLHPDLDVRNLTIEELRTYMPTIEVGANKLTLSALFMQNTLARPSPIFHIHDPGEGPSGNDPNWRAVLNFDPNLDLYARYLDLNFNEMIPGLEVAPQGHYLEKPNKVGMRFLAASALQGVRVHGFVLPVDGVFHVGCAGEVNGGLTAIYGTRLQNPEHEYAPVTPDPEIPRVFLEPPAAQ
jgi:hypothetical protein